MICADSLARVALIGLVGLVVTAPSSAGAVTLGELYGRWSVEKDCSFYEIFIDEIYFGPPESGARIRKATFSLSGTVLTHRNIGNRGEKDTIRKYQVIDADTLKVISVEDVPGKTGAGSFPGLVGQAFSRCR